MTMKNDKPATRINGYEIAPDADLRSADLRGAELDYANLSHLSSQDKHSGRKPT